MGVKLGVTLREEHNPYEVCMRRKCWGRGKYKKNGESYIMSNFIIGILHHILLR